MAIDDKVAPLSESTPLSESNVIPLSESSSLSESPEASAFLRYISADDAKTLAPKAEITPWKDMLLAKGTGKDISILMAADLISKPKPEKGISQGICRKINLKEISGVDATDLGADGILIKGPSASVQKFLDLDYQRVLAFQKQSIEKSK